MITSSWYWKGRLQTQSIVTGETAEDSSLPHKHVGLMRSTAPNAVGTPASIVGNGHTSEGTAQKTQIPSKRKVLLLLVDGKLVRRAETWSRRLLGVLILYAVVVQDFVIVVAVLIPAQGHVHQENDSDCYLDRNTSVNMTKRDVVVKCGDCRDLGGWKTSSLRHSMNEATAYRVSRKVVTTAGKTHQYASTSTRCLKNAKRSGHQHNLPR
jgi:hypothetical protein